MARLKPYCIKQAEAIMPVILKQIYDLSDLTDTQDLEFWWYFYSHFTYLQESQI